MNHMNHKTLIEEIFTYYSHGYSNLILSIWESYLSKHLTIEEMKQATFLIITEEKFLPTPQLIVEKIKGNRKQQGLKTWYELLTCEGKYKAFSPKIRKILAQIGHIHLMNKSELTQAKRDFLELYNLAAETPWQNSNPEKTLNSEVSSKEIPINPSIKTIEQFSSSFEK